MTNEQIQHYESKLKNELELLKDELKTVGRVNPDNPSDWEAKPEDMDVLKADENEVADKFEEYEENAAILKPLEARYNEVKNALERIKSGKYGICEICGKEIELDRLEANPAATTCKAHMK